LPQQAPQQPFAAFVCRFEVWAIDATAKTSISERETIVRFMRNLLFALKLQSTNFAHGLKTTPAAASFA
jgi:hypothetical protein